MSMTGFGRCEKNGVVVEIRSVNHRYFDFHTKIPQSLSMFEDKIKKTCQKYLTRGRVDCSISISSINDIKRSLHIDWNLIDEYYQFIRQLKEKYELNDEISISHFLQQNELVSIIEKETNDYQLEELLITAVEEAVQNLQNMRMIEGRALQNQLNEYLNGIESLILDITKLAPSVKLDYENKIRKKIIEYTDGFFDESKVLTEIAFFAERVDISEELTRLNSHLVQFRQTIQSCEPIGRKCDFLIQELNREVNTIASKANSADISKKVVDLKSVIEKIREQVQNIE
ncbi:YicC/YloC family endoribonuclease [Bacillus andreraoultii]|uniref:YicC/YloC family endoribonuclease n=1 Tax=Bacillus andreraoultii TaxID=1499685 RepID=UPI00067F69F4|nr:YicC/YloC family endoribonuclease [Bacillus andreraoultii]